MPTSSAVCYACGAPIADETVRCDECGARIKPRKRGEAAGVRIDHGRLDAVLSDTDAAAHQARWGKTSERAPAQTPDAVELPPRTRSTPPPPIAEPVLDVAPSTAAPQVALAASVPEPAILAPAAAPTAQEGAPSPTELRPAPEPAADGGKGAPPYQVPLDAEVVVLFPGAQPAPTTAPRATPTEGRVAVRPPVLASEALLRDLAPSEPAAWLGRFWAFALGAAGLCVVQIAGGEHGMGVPLSALFLALLLLGLPRMPYAARASAVTAVAGSGLALVLWTEELARATQPDALVLTIAVALLATGLFLRGWHRASNLARALVAIGLLAGACYLAIDDALRSLTVFDTEWQSWVPRLMSVCFGLLLMLALLAFMDSRTTGGCGVWGACMLCFYTLTTSIDLLRAIWPKSAASPELSRVSSDIALSWLCAPLFTAAFCVALSQLLAATMAEAIAAGRRRVFDQRPT